jgi:hypothetical protein
VRRQLLEAVDRSDSTSNMTRHDIRSNPTTLTCRCVLNGWKLGQGFELRLTLGSV